MPVEEYTLAEVVTLAIIDLGKGMELLSVGIFDDWRLGEGRVHTDDIDVGQSGLFGQMYLAFIAPIGYLLGLISSFGNLLAERSR